MIKTHNGSKLGVRPAHKKAMMRNLSTSLFMHEKITTTLPKAKELVRFAEKIISKAKVADLNSIKAIHSEISDKEVVKKLIEVLGPRYKDRNGGYTQILKAGKRRGDAAETAVVSLVI
jgi:large subunit ribosomal protein L17